jgi:preprotein translocase subunit SecE
MASRAQRRAQRRQREAGGAGAGGAAADASFSQRARSRQAQVRPAQQQSRGQTGRREIQRGSFVRESVAELRKVDWPDQRQVTTGTVVVIIACAICGAYLWVNDLVWQRVVEAIL